ncbi:UDP-N-acetylglucosamine 4,6-dehydratase [Heyndrickxia sporothermodurans]|nr:UDP-N-acetylglucosamine 4,6-dehydratase [Heyndrickxia sporothermodurans]
MTYKQRMSLFIIIDSCLVILASLISHLLVNSFIFDDIFPVYISSIVILISHHVFIFKNQLYKKAWEYASTEELLIILKSVTFSITTAAIIQLIITHHFYFRVLVITWLLNVLFIGGTRFFWRVSRDSILQPSNNKKRTLIVGAGSAGMMVARQLKKYNDSNLLPVGFIDDNIKKHHLDILGIPVLGGVEIIEEKVNELGVDHIIIAIPSLGKNELNIIFNECAKTKAKTKILPMLEDIVTGKVSINQFRDVKVEDLLGRKPVELHIESISEYITGKIVLVTGAGGSIGSEICRQIALFKPRKLILLGHGENSIYSIEMELKTSFSYLNIEFVPVIADIQDFNRMMIVMKSLKPDVVYHAAAHKHVPLMEENPEEAVKNNLIGTINVAKAARTYFVKTFVMISSDKAVNPTSVMGASKKLAEIMIQYMNNDSETKFVTVRFGNVLGSRGSVIPLFKNQIENGGPITVTHPNMIRYFMTIPEASRLVIQAGALAEGGEIFVLDMGDPVKIVDLAKNLIKLSGNTVEDIGITYTGIRPGEKLFEELLKDDEVNDQQIYPNIYIGKTVLLNIEEIEKLLRNYLNMNKNELRNHLLNLANNEVMKMPVFSTSM